MLCRDLETLLRDQLIGYALLKYRRGRAIADHCEAYSWYGDDAVGALAAAVGVHPATLREERRVAIAYPDEPAFVALLDRFRTWNRITEQLPAARTRTKTETLETVDRDCYRVENTGRLIARVLSDPPDDLDTRRELAGTFIVLARDAAQAAMTLDPALEVESGDLTSDIVPAWAGDVFDAFDDSPLSKTDRAMFAAWVAMRGGETSDDYAKTYRALMRVMENPREPMSRKGR